AAPPGPRRAAFRGRLEVRSLHASVRHAEVNSVDHTEARNASAPLTTCTVASSIRFPFSDGTVPSSYGGVPAATAGTHHNWTPWGRKCYQPPKRCEWGERRDSNPLPPPYPQPNRGDSNRDVRRAHPGGLLRLVVRHQAVDGRAPRLAGLHRPHRPADQPR